MFVLIDLKREWVKYASYCFKVFSYFIYKIILLFKNFNFSFDFHFISNNEKLMNINLNLNLKLYKT
jgi:hypothetical protein